MENKPNPTIEDLLILIGDMVKNFSEHQGPIKMTPEILADIDKLEAAASIFKEDTEELFKILNINTKELKIDLLESSEIKTEDKQLIKRAEDIENDARVIKLALSKMQKKGRQSKSQAEDQESTKKQMKERRKLFKTIGGDQKWIPL